MITSEGKMKCFVHLGFNPVPKAVKNAESAIDFAENHLKKDDDEDDPISWKIKWRRDDLYPDNFYDYTFNDLENELAQRGTVVLQLIKDQPDDQPLMGETATIFTADIEKKNDEIAEMALGKIEENLERKQIDIHGESIVPMRRRMAPKKKSKQS
jgi:hypothetical protein